MFTNLANELGHHLMSVLKHVGQRRSQILCVCRWQTQKTSNLTNLMFEHNLNHIDSKWNN